VTPPVSVEAILFDFDYTLGDSSAGIVACVNHALVRLGREPASTGAILPTIGLTLEEIYERLTGDAPAPPAFRTCFVERADRIMLDATVLYPEVPGVVARLRRAGLQLGVVTTKYARRVEAILDRADLRDAFAVVIGSDSVPVSKPDPAGLLAALARLGVDAARGLYVGDSVVDAEAARRAGVSFVAVLSGPTPATAFAAHPTAEVLDRVAALPGWLGLDGDLGGS